MKLREYEVIKVKSFYHSLFNLPIVYYLWAIFLLNLRTCSLTGKKTAKELGPSPCHVWPHKFGKPHKDLGLF